MDETRGASTLNLPAEAVREVIVSRATAGSFSVAERDRRRAGYDALRWR